MSNLFCSEFVFHFTARCERHFLLLWCTWRALLTIHSQVVISRKQRKTASNNTMVIYVNQQTEVVCTALLLPSTLQAWRIS